MHQSFNENGRSELLAIGVLNSISSGILLYSECHDRFRSTLADCLSGGLCQLLFSEWVVGDMRDASRKRIAVALISLGLGLFGMSIIGKWT